MINRVISFLSVDSTSVAGTNLDDTAKWEFISYPSTAVRTSTGGSTSGECENTAASLTCISLILVSIVLAS